MKKLLFLLPLILMLFGCRLLSPIEYEQWEHTIIASNYSVEGNLYRYKYEDDRFNTTDWFDVFMDNSYWDDNYSWGPFDSVFDSGVFYYQPEYYDGYVEWYSYGEDIVGATLRFYRMHIK